MRERAWLVASGVGALVFAAFAWSHATDGALMGLDAFDAAFHGAHPVILEAARILSVMGGTLALAALIGSAAAVFAWRRKWWAALRVAFVPLVADGAVRVFKLAFARPRPEDALLDLASYSFPSGHATNGAVLAVLLAWFALRRPHGRAAAAGLLTAGALWALVMAVDRLVLRVHHVTDVLAGAALGVAVACGLLWASLRAERRWPLRRDEKRDPGVS